MDGRKMKEMGERNGGIPTEAVNIKFVIFNRIYESRAVGYWVTECWEDGEAHGCKDGEEYCSTHAGGFWGQL